MIIGLVISTRIDHTREFWSKSITEELKGFAILAIILSHIGYFLVSDNRFLYPFSILAGVGVNLFLILSGFGLTTSAIEKPLTARQFYKKRLLKLFLPLWIVLLTIFIGDDLILHRIIPSQEIWQSLVGFFPRADVWINVDSPLWYFSLILFYYLIFPLLFIRKWPLISCLLVSVATIGMLNLSLPVNKDVVRLYNQHDLTFPLGMVLAVISQKWRIKINNWVRHGLIVVAITLVGYTAIHSSVGQDPLTEELISIVTSLGIIAVFGLSKLNVRILGLLGVLSYEIYLVHWPILSRYNLFTALSPTLMVIFNLILIVGVSYILNELVKYAVRKTRL